MGRGRTEVWPHPAHSSSHPPTPRTPLTWHHVSVREQTALLSVTGSNFLLSLSLPLSLPPLFPSLILFFSPSLPLSSSLFVLFSRTTKGRQSQGWRHPSSLWPLKKDSSPSHPSLHWNRQHTDTCTWCTHSFTLASSFVFQQCPCARHEAACHDSLLISHTSTFTKKDTDTLTTTKLVVKLSFINGSLGGFLTDTQGDVTLASWLTATTQIHLP